MYYEVKVRLDKTQENGLVKKVTETYLVDAVSFTEAEARIIKEITPFATGEFEIANIKKARYAEIFFSGEDRYYECRLEFITLDEKTGYEKKIRQTVLVQASDLKDAMSRLSEAMRGVLADYNAVSIKETNILDVYKYEVQ